VDRLALMDLAVLVELARLVQCGTVMMLEVWRLVDRLASMDLVDLVELAL